MTSSLPDDVFPVVVIGAGLAGLSAAVHLSARDVPPLVLEADTEWPGGRLSGGAPDTFEHNGRTWSFGSEHGAHALWGGYDNMRAMFERFIDIDLNLSYGEEWINRWGNEVRYVEAGTNVRRSWLPAPLHYLQLLLNPQFWTTITPLDFLSLPGFITSLLWTTAFDPIMEQIDLPGLTIDDYFRFWTPNLKATFRGLGHNLLAAPSEDITLAAFIAAIRFYTLLRRDTWQLGYLPANAHDCVIQPMIDKIEENGMVMLGTRAVSLSRNGAYWDIRVEDAKHGGMRSLTAAAVILATEPLAAQTLLLNSPELAARASQITFPPTLRGATARMWFDAQPREGAPGGMFTGDFEIDNFFWLQRIHSEFAAWNEAGCSAIEVHYYAPDTVYDQPDHMLLVTATTEVLRAFPELRGHFVHGAIRNNGRTQTQFMIPTAKSLHVESPWPGIYACGDWIGYPSPCLWMERCTVTGMAAANHVLAAHGAEPWAMIPPREPEALPKLMTRVLRLLRRIFGPVIGLLRRWRR
ncbi:MAG: NAD(P)-binding protein [Anaerolineae bacterium]|nr:NAD(P)-binding protein [Anaerolineae bacterium]